MEQHPEQVEKKKEAARIWASNNKEHRQIIRRAHYLKTRHLRQGQNHVQVLRKYNLSDEQFQAILAAQNGICAICKQPENLMRAGMPRPLSVDHDHETGQIRGILCHRCNAAIGLMRDSTQLLEAAINYLCQW